MWPGGPQRPRMLEGAAASAAGAGNPTEISAALRRYLGKSVVVIIEGMVLLAGAGGSALWRTAVATVGAVTLSAAGMILLEIGAEGLAMA